MVPMVPMVPSKDERPFDFASNYNHWGRGGGGGSFSAAKSISLGWPLTFRQLIFKKPTKVEKCKTTTRAFLGSVATSVTSLPSQLSQLTGTLHGDFWGSSGAPWASGAVSLAHTVHSISNSTRSCRMADWAIRTPS